MKLYIKYMVSLRCKMVVKSELEKLEIPFTSVELGEVDVPGNISYERQEQLSLALLQCGLELMDDKKSILIEAIKTAIMEAVNGQEYLKINFSDHLAEKLGYNYTYLANLFSSIMAINIENFIIYHKIERIKELLIYGELSLTEIAYKLNYSSVAHLSNQFKKFTGLTPSFFKNVHLVKKQNALENMQML